MHMVAARLGFEKTMVGTRWATPRPDCMDRLRKHYSHLAEGWFLWGVIRVKFNMHNISNMSIAFIQLTMPTCMHNMSMFMHNMSMFMHNMPMFMHNMPMFMHNMPMLMHNMSVFMHNMSVFMHNMSVFMHNVNVHAQYAIM